MANYYYDGNLSFQDFDLLVEGEWLYAMYVKKAFYPQDQRDAKPPNRYGIAKSRDGLSWQEVGDIMPGSLGSWDESLWAGGISKQDGQYVIYYTAVKIIERQSSCKIGKVCSKDLKHWEKDPANPVWVFDPSNPFYSDEPALAFRDPFFFEYQGKRYLLFCGKDKKQPSRKQGCVGIAEEISPGKINWMPPLFSPGSYFDGLECPALYEIEGRWYLLYGQDGENGGKAFRYAMGHSPLGPFKEFSDNQLLSTNNYGCRIVEFRGKKLLYHWYTDHVNGQVRTRLAPPKEVHIVKDTPNGRLDGRISLSELEHD